jgi:hypothetical protein
MNARRQSDGNQIMIAAAAGSAIARAFSATTGVANSCSMQKTIR